MKAHISFILAGLLLLGAVPTLSQDEPSAPPRSDPGAEPGPRGLLERPERPFPGRRPPGRPPFPHRRQQREMVRVFDDATVEANVSVPQLVNVFGETVIDGEVRGDAVVVLGPAKVNGPVGGDLVVVMGEAELTENARVSGDLVVVGGQLNEAPGAEIQGERVVLPLANMGHRLSQWLRSGLFMIRPLPPGVGLAWTIVGLHLLIYFFIALLLPRPVAMTVQELRLRAGPSFLVGILGMILWVPLVLILISTGVGVLLLPLLWLLLTGAIFLGKTAMLQFIGGQAFGRFKAGGESGVLLSLFLGAAVVTVVYMIPILGLVAWAVFVPFALGSVLLAIAQSFQQRGAQGVAPSGPVAPGPMPLAPDGPQTGATSSVAGVPSSVGSDGPADDAGSPPAAGAADPGTRAATAGDDVAPDARGVVGAVPPTGGASATTDWTPGACCPMAATVTSFSPAELAVMPRAGFWLRLVATLLDFILLIWVLPVAERWFVPIWVAFHVALWTWKGTTIGGIVCGLKVIRTDGRPVDFTVALVRSLGSVFSLVALGLGFFWVGWTRERLAWHDRIAGTTIVKLPKGVSLI